MQVNVRNILDKKNNMDRNIEVVCRENRGTGKKRQPAYVVK